MKEAFRKFASKTSEITGSSWAFTGALMLIVVWAVTGPLFGFSDTWQLVINTGTTIVTFLMVFLIQNSQNRDTKALHLKLDELIKSNNDARNTFLKAEDMTEEELEREKKAFEKDIGEVLDEDEPQKRKEKLDRVLERAN